MTRPRVLVSVAGVMAFLTIPTPAQSTPGQPASTPPEMTATYNSLADGILALRRSESNLVKAILASTYGNAEATLEKARARIESKKDARAAMEKLAAFVAQLGNEGDATVAGIRKRLLEGGHHHNSAAEQQGVYDEGFVVVTRVARKAFLDLAGRIGKLALAPDLAALNAEWQSVVKQYDAVKSEAGH
ncbi:MAG TPA: hypothetical protein VGK94_15320 [Candidatus Polarisedimenticolia bacterium]